MIETKIRRSSACSKFERGVLMLDSYKRPFSLLMPENTDRYRTFVGAFFTIVTLLVVLSYASYKFNDLLNQSDY